MQKADAYLMYVRPTLEYAAVAWATHTKCDTEKLEAVQRRAARFVMSDFNRTSSVTEMLHNINWNTLSCRRQTSRLYKILHNLVDITLPSQATLHYQPDLQEDTIKNLSYPNHLQA